MCGIVGILEKNKKKISCIFIEPIQGCLPNKEAKNYLQFLDRYCKKKNIILEKNIFL